MQHAGSTVSPGHSARCCAHLYSTARGRTTCSSPPPLLYKSPTTAPARNGHVGHVRFHSPSIQSNRIVERDSPHKSNTPLFPRSLPTGTVLSSRSTRNTIVGVSDRRSHSTLLTAHINAPTNKIVLSPSGIAKTNWGRLYAAATH